MDYMRRLIGRSDSRSDELGTLSVGPSAGLRAQLEQVRESIGKTSALAQEYNRRLAELSAFNHTLTNAYINNLNIVVDISGILNEYKILMSTVIEQLKTFDTSVAENFRTVNVEHIRSLTSDKLQNIAQFFNSPEFLNLKNTFTTHGRTDDAMRLTAAEQQFRDVQAKASETISSCGRGARGRKKRGGCGCGKKV